MDRLPVRGLVFLYDELIEQIQDRVFDTTVDIQHLYTLKCSDKLSPADIEEICVNSTVTLHHMRELLHECKNLLRDIKNESTR